MTQLPDWAQWAIMIFVSLLVLIVVVGMVLDAIWPGRNDDEGGRYH